MIEPTDEKFILKMFHSDPQLYISVRNVTLIRKVPEEKILQQLNKNIPFLDMMRKRHESQTRLLKYTMRDMSLNPTIDPLWNELIESDQMIPGFVDAAALKLSKLVECPECMGSGDDLEDSSRECFFCHGSKKVRKYRTE